MTFGAGTTGGSFTAYTGSVATSSYGLQLNSNAYKGRAVVWGETNTSGSEQGIFRDIVQPYQAEYYWRRAS